ncbi:MAG: DNA photolyase [Desulfobulbaceae bacterium DB1]|nr:MAG: DNA photolyase [Desulfobulbaceae bacterium DB1]
MLKSDNYKHRPVDPARFIRKIFLEESCRDLPYAREILQRASGIPVEIIADRTMPILDAAAYPRNLTTGKQNLLLCANKGSFFKPCPGTKQYCCCDYQVLNIGMNCPMDCVYCILQAYLNNPWISFFVNVEDLVAELELAFSATNQFWRIGTGEFTDSLALDSLTGLSRILVPFMSDKTKGVLELKTKSASIGHLEDLDHGGRTIVSWSLNSQAVMEGEEFKTATLDQRLDAAAQCARWGYKLAFHFDPIIYHPGWQEGYAATISKLFNTVPAEKIVWISLGALRFLPALRPIALTRFPNSKFFHEEFVLGLDGKYRYFRSQRVELYQHLLKHISERVHPATCLYFCMESEEIWQECGFDPVQGKRLPEALDQAVASCP